jgi:hypothetical protein
LFIVADIRSRNFLFSTCLRSEERIPPAKMKVIKLKNKEAIDAILATRDRSKEA